MTRERAVRIDGLLFYTSVWQLRRTETALLERAVIGALERCVAYCGSSFAMDGRPHDSAMRSMWSFPDEVMRALPAEAWPYHAATNRHPT
ncbi:MAG: hypothetical protein OXD31_09885 [Chloroflexi bacterium]|nr:hypothetical protein [Chloroflexota bacterium]